MKLISISRRLTTVDKWCRKMKLVFAFPCINSIASLGLTAEAILKARKSPPHNLVSSTPPGYPGLQQLPPQPYIPPPGSASIHYSQFQSKPGPVQYPNFAIPQTPQTTTSQQPAVPSQASGAANSKQAQQQFLVPQASSQAPPGSNPYPPPQFVSPPTAATATAAAAAATATATTAAAATEATAAVAVATETTVPKFSSTTPPPPGNQVYPPPATPSGQSQKSLFNHPAPPRS